MTLFLLPNLLGPQEDWGNFLPASVRKAVLSLNTLIAESEKGGRNFLRCFMPQKFRNLPLFLLNEHSQKRDIEALAQKVKEGGNWGLVSDAGLPCLADPGADLVLRLRSLKVPIHAFAGPSAIVLGLILSGLGGQSFAFHGYPPLHKRKQFFAALEKRSKWEKATQIFIEAPYRNEQCFKDLLSVLQGDTYLTCAVDLTFSTEWVQTQKISSWQQAVAPSIQKKPCVFLLKA